MVEQEFQSQSKDSLVNFMQIIKILFNFSSQKQMTPQIDAQQQYIIPYLVQIHFPCRF